MAAVSRGRSARRSRRLGNCTTNTPKRLAKERCSTPACSNWSTGSASPAMTRGGLRDGSASKAARSSCRANGRSCGWRRYSVPMRLGGSTGLGPSSCSLSVRAGSPAQSKLTHGNSRWGLRAWMIRARYCLPLPAGPTTLMANSERLASRACSSTRCMPGCSLSRSARRKDWTWAARSCTVLAVSGAWLRGCGSGAAMAAILPIIASSRPSANSGRNVMSHHGGPCRRLGGVRRTVSTLPLNASGGGASTRWNPAALRRRTQRKR
jgi:hypothetical protein